MSAALGLPRESVRHGGSLIGGPFQWAAEVLFTVFRAIDTRAAVGMMDKLLQVDYAGCAAVKLIQRHASAIAGGEYTSRARDPGGEKNEQVPQSHRPNPARFDFPDVGTREDF